MCHKLWILHLTRQLGEQLAATKLCHHWRRKLVILHRSVLLLSVRGWKSFIQQLNFKFFFNSQLTFSGLFQMVPQQYRKSCIHELDWFIWRSELICASCSLFDSSDWLFFLPNVLRWLFLIHIRVLWLPIIPVQPCQLSVFTTFFSICSLFCLGSFLELQFPQRSKFLRTGAFVLPFLFDSVPLFYRVSVGADRQTVSPCVSLVFCQSCRIVLCSGNQVWMLSLDSII